MRIKQWIPAAAWAFVIFFTSCFYIPSKKFVHGVVSAGSGHVSERQFNHFWGGWWWLFVKGYHVLEYAILTALLLRALAGIHAKRLLLAAVIALLYASSDEWHQTFVRDRGGKWTDVAIDAIGIALVAISYVAVRRLRLRSRRD